MILLRLVVAVVVVVVVVVVVGVVIVVLRIQRIIAGVAIARGTMRLQLRENLSVVLLALDFPWTCVLQCPISQQESDAEQTWCQGGAKSETRRPTQTGNFAVSIASGS